MPEPLAQKVREAAAELGRFTAKDLVVFLNYKGKSIIKIRKAIDYLKKWGHVVSLRPGFYLYQDKQKPLMKIEKMWRGILIKEYFTRQDILKLSGASFRYVERYFSFLKREGLITHVSGSGYKNGLYCLTDPDTAPLERPITSRGRLVSFEGGRKH